MTGYVTTAQGVTTVLPTPVSWCFQYTSGVPCDSFRLRCIWDGDNQVKPEEWAMFQALKDGEVRFTGVVDECEILLGPEGAFFEVSGRGMAARLLDNEALSQDYELATPADILRDHVEPYGIRTEGGAALGPVSRFSVAAGSSEWAVLYEFARYHNGICPRFDREGRLITLEFPAFYFATVYVPNSQRELTRLDYRMQWEDDFLAYLQTLDQNKPVIFCGDLNVAHREIDLKNPKTNHKNAGFTDEERGKMTALLGSGFTDTFRYFYPDATGIYSWWSYMFHAREKNAGWRIDYFITSDRLQPKLRDAKIHTDIFGSDHCPIELDIDL